MAEETKSRKATLNTIQTILGKADEMELGECVGVVFLFHDTYIKAIWKKDADREKTAGQLMSASIDEISKT